MSEPTLFQGSAEPLAARMRPRNLEQFLGQVYGDDKVAGNGTFSGEAGLPGAGGIPREVLVPELLVPDGFGWTSRQIALEYDEPQSALVEAEPAQGTESLEMAQHLVSLAAADEEDGQPSWRRRRRNAIERLSGEPA